MVLNENFHHDQSRSPKGFHSPYDRTLTKEVGMIRLLLLQPSSCYQSDIYGEMRETILLGSMKSALPYEPFEALSYTWGTGQCSSKIIINGIVMPIKSNLDAFLRRRRQVDRAVPLWIDALCINQEDNEEKNQLIPLMGTIYTAAIKLTIWLGPADTDSDLAMDNLHDIGRCSPYDKVPHLSRQILDAIRHLLSRPWWSRVWIIQEVVLGGLAEKMEKVLVMCGEKEITWMDLVIAAARLWSHHAERRQYFPNIQAILDLDRLRHDSVGPLLSSMRGLQAYGTPNPSEPLWVITLLSEYRHFQATDARDKVYALANIFSIYPQRSITPDYTATTTSIYTDFAGWALQHCAGLELLRHCGTRDLNVPSWVPDWSASQNLFPLPSKNRSRLRGAPWWCQPHVEIEEGPSGQKMRNISYPVDDPLTDPEHKFARRQLEIGARGSGMIKSLNEVPKNFKFLEHMEGLTPAEEHIIDRALGTNAAALLVCNNKAMDSIRMKGEDVDFYHQQSMQREMHHRLLSDRQETPYQAAGATCPKFRINEQKLMVEGVVWDEIESVHSEFVSDVDANFEDTTRFMVVLGQCKAMAEDSLCASRRLPDLKERLRSFWLCILAGRPGTSDLDPSIWVNREPSFDPDPMIEYMTWLPPIPSTWKPGTAPVTATTYGLINHAEKNERMQTALDLVSELEKGGKYKPCAWELSEFIPKDWTLDEHKMYQDKFRELGLLWSEQRFDLYHTPFEFLNIVPDPYWDTRKDHDQLAMRKTLEWFSDMQVGFTPVGNGSDDDLDEWIDDDHPTTKIFQEEMARLWNSKITRIPRGTLKSGYEKYALGRKFFITKKGYFGLGSKEVKRGDKIVVLSGSDVPFVLRTCGKVEGRRNWQIIGEAYVDGIMNGEVMDQVDLGNSQPSLLCIS